MYLAKKVEPRYLFCHKKNIHWAKQLESDMGYSVTAITMEQLNDDDHNTENCPSKLDKNHFHHLYNYQCANSKSLHLIPTACKDVEFDVNFIVMSSGTTGKPKAIAVTHAACINESLALEERGSNRGAKVRFACTASLDYVSGRLILFGSIAVGYTSIIMDGFEPRAYLEAIEKYRINIVYIGAASFYNLITHRHLDEYDISSLRVIFPMGAKIIYLDELARFFAKHPHIVQVKQGYGASELAGGAMNTMTPQEYLKNSDCCGQMLPGMEAKIVDPDTGERVLEPYARGMLHMRGFTLFPGYYDMEQVRLGRSQSPFVRDESVFDQEGYYITGDVAYFNENRELFIVGRQKETMCCRAAKKVLPQELEEVIEQHEAVSKVCVLGIPNQVEKTLHCPRAFVVLSPNVGDLEKYAQKTINNNNNNNAADADADAGINSSEILKFRGNNKLCSSLNEELRRTLMIDIMRFVDERIGWEKQLTGGLVLLDDMPTLRETGKVNKGYLRSLTIEQIEVYGDRSSAAD